MGGNPTGSLLYTLDMNGDCFPSCGDLNSEGLWDISKALKSVI